MADKSTQGAQAGALAAFTDHYGDLGWPVERVEIAKHGYVRFEDQRVDGMWMAFKTGWELSATVAPAVSSEPLDNSNVADEK